MLHQIVISLNERLYQANLKFEPNPNRKKIYCSLRNFR